jgi:hypothetical protein
VKTAVIIIQSAPHTESSFVDRSLWRYVEGGILWKVAVNRNMLQLGIFVHRLPWALSEVGSMWGLTGCSILI